MAEIRAVRKSLRSLVSMSAADGVVLVRYHGHSWRRRLTSAGAQAERAYQMTSMFRPRWGRRHRGRHAAAGGRRRTEATTARSRLSLIHISEPTRLGMISYAVFCLT